MSNSVNTGNGPVTRIFLPDSGRDLAVISFIAIALYNVVELTIIILTTFTRRRGLYFWSFCVATWGIPPYGIGFILIGVGLHRPALYGAVAMIAVGWACMVTGQSLVLYSRLHLIDHDARHLRFVLAIILIDGLVLHLVTTVMVFGANSAPSSAQRFHRPYSIVEKVQVSVFAAQELLISLLYIWAAARYFRTSASVRDTAAAARKRMLRHLIAVNVVVIMLDMTVLGLEYSDNYRLQATFKGMAYSIKLKLEFRILNDLVNITRTHGSPPPTSASSYSHTHAPEPRHTCHDDSHAVGRLASAPASQHSSTVSASSVRSADAAGAAAARDADDCTDATATSHTFRKEGAQPCPAGPTPRRPAAAARTITQLTRDGVAYRRGLGMGTSSLERISTAAPDGNPGSTAEVANSGWHGQ